MATSATDMGGYPSKLVLSSSTVDRMGFPISTFGTIVGSDQAGYANESDPWFRYVVVLAHAEGAHASTVITNSSLQGVAGTYLLTAGNTAQIDTGQAPAFGSGSILFNSVSNPFVRNNVASSLLNFGLLDFTIECRIRWRGTTGQIQTLYDGRDAADGAFPRLIIDSTASPVDALCYHANSATQIIGPKLPVMEWVHVALCRKDGITRLFINGSQVSNDYVDATDYPSAKLSFGLARIGSQPLSAWLDEIRITKGVARYDGPYVPKPGRFPDH